LVSFGTVRDSLATPWLKSNANLPAQPLVPPKQKAASRRPAG
jgi:hypothetical protein